MTFQLFSQREWIPPGPGLTRAACSFLERVAPFDTDGCSCRRNPHEIAGMYAFQSKPESYLARWLNFDLMNHDPVRLKTVSEAHGDPFFRPKGLLGSGLEVYLLARFIH